jgi:hypothetical protein
MVPERRIGVPQNCGDRRYVRTQIGHFCALI